VRFSPGGAGAAERLKLLRHAVSRLESAVDPGLLLAHRDTGTDPFAGQTRPEELRRDSVDSVVRANLKRGQEAARVLEEYLKLLPGAKASEAAKQIRFEVYDIEKLMLGSGGDGGTQETET